MTGTAPFWTVPALFTGKIVAILATGPSLDREDIEAARRAGFSAIAVNNAYEYAPWAEILYAADRKWWESYGEAGALGGPGALAFRGLKVTIMEPTDPCILRIGHGGTHGFDLRPDHVRTGSNSATQAAHIAVHGGARRIVLLGCDCRAPVAGPAHCFGDHDWRKRKDSPYELFLEGWRKFAAELPKTVEIINCTPGSAIDCFPRAALEDIT